MKSEKEIKEYRDWLANRAKTIDIDWYDLSNKESMMCDVQLLDIILSDNAPFDMDDES